MYTQIVQFYPWIHELLNMCLLCYSAQITFTYRPPTDHLTTDHLPPTYRPHTHHLPTTYWPLFLRCSLFTITLIYTCIYLFIYPSIHLFVCLFVCVPDCSWSDLFSFPPSLICTSLALYPVFFYIQIFNLLALHFFSLFEKRRCLHLNRVLFFQ